MSAHSRDRDYLSVIWEAMGRIHTYTSGLDLDIPDIFPHVETILRYEGGHQ